MTAAAIPDYERLRATLVATDDAEVAAVVRILDPVFRSPRYRPDPSALEGEAALCADVAATFPTPFARRFASWQDAQADFARTLERQAALATAGPAGAARPVAEVPPDAAAQQAVDAQDAAAAELRRRFRDAQLEAWACWRQVVHFLPFVLIAALRRLDDARLEADAARELKQALHHYRAFYETYDDDRRREADQRHLLVALLKLFRRVSAAGGLDGDGIFAPLLAPDRRDFARLFPERFDAAMLLLQQLRNRLAHGGLENRAPPALAAVHQLAHWCFLDAVATLAPLCRRFGLSYVTELAVTATGVTLEALEFRGRAGPVPVRFRASAAPQPDEQRVAELRLYLVAHERREGGAAAAELAPGDFLDLTPFLIAQGLRDVLARPEPRSRGVFALHQYRQAQRDLVFLELAGTDQRRLDTGRDARLKDLLLAKIDGFVARVRLITAQVELRAGKGVDVDRLRAQWWLLSREHLASVPGPVVPSLPPGSAPGPSPAVDAPGARSGPDADRPPSRTAPRVFVEPAEAAAVRAFFASDRRALLVVGASGSGKSSLLVHHFLEQAAARRLAAFLAGRQIDQPSFRQVLLAQLLRPVAAGAATLADLDAVLEEAGETLYLFVDAINEYSGPLGAVALLHDVIATLVQEESLRRCKVVVSCRGETWWRYRQQYGGERPLDPAVFATADGDALTVGTFDASRRRALFEAYQAAYDLRPADWAALAPTVQALFAQPFLLALAAEAWSNRDLAPDRGARSLPRELDYFTLFDRLTARKKADAAVLLPAADIIGRARLPDAIDGLCTAIAALLHARLVAPDAAAGADGRAAAVPVDDVDKAPELQSWVRDRDRRSVLEIVLELGLVLQVSIPRRNRLGRVVAGDAFAFFHDQYAQYWLASAYQAGIVGWLDGETLADPARLDACVARVADLVRQAARAPVLGGALDHWLHLNLQNFHAGDVGALLPFLERLAAHPSPAVRHTLVGLLFQLLLRGILGPAELFGPLVRDGSPALVRELVAGFAEFGAAVPPGAVATFVDTCDPERDAEPVDRLADVFALALLRDPEGTAAYLRDVLPPLTLLALAQPQRVARSFRFALQITTFAILGGFDRPDVLDAVRRLFHARYALAIDLLTGRDPGPGPTLLARRALRRLLFWTFESVGAAKFQHFMAAMPGSGNERFFEDCDGVVQRDVLRAFLPYAIAVHNGDFAGLSLAPGSAFRELMLRMLDFRVTSIIGYNAVLCLPGVLLRADWAAVEAFVLNLVERRTPAALFHGNLLLLNLAYSDPRLAPQCLGLIERRIYPLLFAEGLEVDWSIAFCIAALDVPRLGSACDALVRALADYHERRGPEAVERFGGSLFKIAYTQDPALAARTLALLLDARERFLAPPWREATLKLCAAMYTRHPAGLRAVLAARPGDEVLEREALAWQSEEVIRHSRLFPLQVDANRFTAWLYVDASRLRRAVIRDFIGSLAAGDSVRDFAAGFRRTLVAIIDAFVGAGPANLPDGPLTEDEVVAAVRDARRWFSRARRAPGS